MRPAPFLALLTLSACAEARFDTPGATDEAAYATAHPYYAEYCALTQIKKKPGFGADIRGQIGGHAVFYLNGACRDADAHYPVLRLCEPSDPHNGAGLSMNAHFRNAKWVAIPGRDLFFGTVARLPVTRATYDAVQNEAKRRGIYEGVQFWPEVFEDKPPTWSEIDWQYEVSVATDYGIALGRGRYCARIPVTRPQMTRMIDFLNTENSPFREGRQEFRWSVFRDNCIHLAHNALAAAGLLHSWPRHEFLPLAMLDFPVPKNEFVNLMRRTNDEWHADPGTLYADLPARAELLADNRLPTVPGALAEAQGPLQPNAVYDTDLKLIFYDEPNIGPYQRRFDNIFTNPRYTDPTANRAHFATLAQTALATRRPLADWLRQAPYRNDPEGFTLIYTRFYALMQKLTSPSPLERGPG